MKHYGRVDDAGGMLMSEFALDRVENPHPRMREHALQLRRSALTAALSYKKGAEILGAVWMGYLDAMCDATGENAEAINAWLDKYDDPDIATKIAEDVAATLPMPRRR